jgi:hypothetical protein
MKKWIQLRLFTKTLLIRHRTEDRHVYLTDKRVGVARKTQSVEDTALFVDRAA